MAKMVVFDVPDYFEGKQLLEDVEKGDVDEWEIVPRNCRNSRGTFLELKIFEKKPDPQGNKILVAELDTRYPGMIHVVKNKEKTIKKFQEILKEYRGQVLILNNWF